MLKDYTYLRTHLHCSDYYPTTWITRLALTSYSSTKCLYPQPPFSDLCQHIPFKTDTKPNKYTEQMYYISNSHARSYLHKSIGTEYHFVESCLGQFFQTLYKHKHICHTYARQFVSQSDQIWPCYNIFLHAWTPMYYLSPWTCMY